NLGVQLQAGTRDREGHCRPPDRYDRRRMRTISRESESAEPSARRSPRSQLTPVHGKLRFMRPELLVASSEHHHEATFPERRRMASGGHAPRNQNTRRHQLRREPNRRLATWPSAGPPQNGAKSLESRHLAAMRSRAEKNKAAATSQKPAIGNEFDVPLGRLGRFGCPRRESAVCGRNQSR